MRMNPGLGSVEDFLKSTENFVSGAGRIRTAYRDAKEGRAQIQEAPERRPVADVQKKMLTVYLAVGAVALIAWVKLMK